MIDIKEKVILGGLPQKIHIKGKDEAKPILLFLHGGPGVCNRHTVMTEHSDLCDSFIVVAWDQRGSGGSYKGTDARTLTIERFVEDANELVEYLCRKFNRKKLFVIGGSWGSELGTLLSFYHPDRIAAFVGFGQVVDGAKNEQISYDFAMNEAVKANDYKSVEILKKVGPPVKGVYRGGFNGMMAQRKIMMKYGGYSQSQKKRSYFSSMVVPMLKSREYTLSELIGVAKGYKFVLTQMWPQVGATCFPETVKEVSVPFFIFDGKLDMNTPAELVTDWFNMLKAPYKELIWFEHSGHNPMGDEGERFKSLLIDRLEKIAMKEANV